MKRVQALIMNLLMAGTVSTVWGLSDAPIQDRLNVNGPIFAIAHDGDKTYVGGRFSQVGNLQRKNLFSFNSVTGIVDSWDPSPNDDVYSIAVGNGKVYVGGAFNSIGINYENVRNHLASFDVNGNLTTWTTDVNGYVRAILVDGTKIYVGGEFTQINGQSHGRLASFSGETLDSWDPNADGIVFSVSSGGGKIYAGGRFNNIGGQSRNYLAAFNSVNGDLNNDWKPAVNNLVQTIATHNNNVYVGGFFTSAGGQYMSGFAAFDQGAGSLLPWANIGLAEFGKVYSIAFNNNKIIIGGNFTAGPKKNLIAINSTTGAIDPWAPNPDSWVNPIHGGSSYLMVGGDFTSMGTASSPAFLAEFELPPLRPTGGSVVSVSATSVTSQWSASPNATSYQLVASTINTNQPTLVAGSATVATTNGSVTGLTGNTTFYLFVNACKNNNCSDFTSLGTGVTLAAVPTLTLGTVTSTTVGLTIGANQNPTGTTYVVEKSADGGATYSVDMTTTQLSATVSGLTPSTAYKFRVKARSHGGILTSASGVVDVAAAPSAPGSVGITGTTETTLQAQWSASSGASNYTLVASTMNSNPPTLVAGNATVTATNGTVTGLAGNTTHYLFVNACNGRGCSGYTSLGTGVTLAAVPTLTLGTVTSTTVGLTIGNENSAGTTYVVEKSADGGTSYTAETPTTQLSVTVSGLTPSTAYKFRVKARSHGGILTSASGVVDVAAAPSAPGSVGITGTTETTLQAQWSASSGASNYTLVASTMNSNPPTLVAGNATVTATNGTVTGLAGNTTHYLFVNACNGRGCSGYTSLGSRVTLTSPVTMSVTSVGSTSARITIDGRNNPAGTVYAVEQSSGSSGTFVRISLGTLLTVTVTDLKPGERYGFRVIGINHAGAESPPSQAVIFEAGDFSTQTMRAFPVPFRPGRGADGMTFDQMPAGGTITIYTMRGELVKTLTAENDKVVWDVKTDGGDPVSSGVYIVVAKGTGGQKVFKIMVQR
jgi:fibronectin type 3 domain-containing protein